jgi:hypothetical protein
MAIMIPPDVEDFTTEGEGIFYKFLENVCKPDEEYIVWYSPDIMDREPDFVMFRRDFGLIIFEIKDWILDQIEEADDKRFIIVKNNKREICANPLYQAKGYRNKTFDKMRKDGTLISSHPKFKGKIRIPINYGAVFTNINKNEFQKTSLSDVCSIEKLFFWDDLHPASPICCDKSGVCFAETIDKKFPQPFPCKITDYDLNNLKQLLYKNVKIEHPEREKIRPFDEQRERLRVLDNNQESIARQINGGHRIIKGPSGSGKTIILVHKAVFLLQYEPNIKKILFVCYNLTLINYVKRLFLNKNVPLGKNGVEVHGFYDLCGEILDEKVDHQNPDDKYYETIIELTSQELENSQRKYDAILVDEGQDFSDDMFKVIKALLNEDTDNLTIALDDNQNIYKRKRSWKNLGINAVGKRTQKIDTVYRYTFELTEFFNQFVQKSENLITGVDNTQLEMFPGFNVIHGPNPLIEQFSNIDEIKDFVTDKIIELTANNVIPFSEIAFIYASNYFREPALPDLPNAFTKAFQSKGIFFYWVSEDVRAKKTYDITTNSVTLSSIHSIKGLDYYCVFLVGLGKMEDNRWTEEQIERLTYVAVTRARNQLYIPYIEKTPLIEKMIDCL